MEEIQALRNSLTKASSPVLVEEACKTFLETLETSDESTLRNPVLEVVFLSLCLKIMDVFPIISPVPGPIQALLSRAVESGLARGVPARLTKKFLENPRNSQSDPAGPPRNFWRAMLDLNGDFLWADPLSERLFESKCGSQNLFSDLMIPFSRTVLSKKFNGMSLFSPSDCPGAIRNFAYVIYSESAGSKFARTLQSKKIFDPEFENEAESPHLNLYFKYLKALSSKATLTAISFRKTELRELSRSQKTGVFLSPKLREILENSSSQSPSGPLPHGVKAEIVDGEEKIFLLAVLLETRCAKGIPPFPYNQMHDDQRIVEMKHRIRNKLSIHKAF